MVTNVVIKYTSYREGLYQMASNVEISTHLSARVYTKWSPM